MNTTTMGSIANAVIVGHFCSFCFDFKRTVIHLYGEQARGLKLVEKLNAIRGLAITPNISGPKIICLECVEQIQGLYNMLESPPAELGQAELPQTDVEDAAADGVAVGTADGTADGFAVGTADGTADGFAVGTADGFADVTADGFADGSADGSADMFADGFADGSADVFADGSADVFADGSSDVFAEDN